MWLSGPFVKGGVFLSLPSALVTFLYLSNIVAALSLLFVRKSDTATTLAWLLVFVFLPYIGFILYFFFGSRAKYKIMTRRYSLSRDSLGKIPFTPSTPTELLNDEARQNLDLININTNGAGSVYTQDNFCELLPSAREKYDRMFAEIDAARQSVNVLYFIIKTHDKSGRDLISLLAKKAREGVKVRLIYDTFGYIRARRSDFRELIEAGGMVYGYLPSFLRTALEANYRMHRKIVVIDGRVAYTGGINIGDDYLGLDLVRTPWRDTSIRITGPAVRDVQLRFVEDWVYIDRQTHLLDRKSSIETANELSLLFPPLEKTGNMGVQIISSGPDSEESYTRDSYQRMISTADRYVYIQTPYFVPDEALLHTLRLAAHAGIDVRVMIPGIPDKKFVYYVTTSYIGELLKSGIRVYVHAGFLHAKTFVLDDAVASIGTTNLDNRSFDLDFEINAMVFDRGFAVQCRDTFMRDIDDCVEMTAEQYKSRSRITRLREGFWRLVAPLV